jgi:hypothetical protein
MDVLQFIESNGHIFWSESPNPGGSTYNSFRKDIISARSFDKGKSLKQSKLARVVEFVNNKWCLVPLEK